MLRMGIDRGAADQVFLRHCIFGLPAQQRFERVPDSDLWHLTLDVPERSRVEYKIEVVEGGAARWILDPLNANAAQDPFGANSVLHGAGYTVPE